MLVMRTLFVRGLALLLPLALAPPAFAADDADWSNVRDAARAHASSIREAWSALDGWITGDPRGRPAALYATGAGNPDDRTEERPPYDWNKGPNSGAWDDADGARGGLPKAVWDRVEETGLWSGEWTRRGLSFRYCDDVLIVFAKKALRGASHADIQAAGGLQRVNNDGKSVTGTPQSGNPSLTLPDCLGTFPEGVVALAGSSLDPFGWRNTRRRNLVTHWQIACEAVPGKDPVGAIRYAQTVPVELHPWERDSTGQPTDMKRWPAACKDRKTGEFDYPSGGSGATFDMKRVFGAPGQPATAPVEAWHGLCAPADLAVDGPGALDYDTGPPWVLEEGGTGRPKVSTPVHLEDAVIDDACIKEADIGRDVSEAPEWLLYDRLCKQAGERPGMVNADGHPVHPDGSTYYKQTTTADGTDVGLPGDYDCNKVTTGCSCPPRWTGGLAGAAGTLNLAGGRLVSKHRWGWKADKTGWKTDVSDHPPSCDDPLDDGSCPDSMGANPKRGWGLLHARNYVTSGPGNYTEPSPTRDSWDYRHTSGAWCVPSGDGAQADFGGCYWIHEYDCPVPCPRRTVTCVLIDTDGDAVADGMDCDNDNTPDAPASGEDGNVGDSVTGSVSTSGPTHSEFGWGGLDQSSGHFGGGDGNDGGTDGSSGTESGNGGSPP